MKDICGNCFQENMEEQYVCLRCGFDNKTNREKYPLALPAGTILWGRYIVGRVLGQGGFGITYLAQDYQTNELVAIKEFFPDTMATRTNSTMVAPFTGERGENFAYGKTSFLDEAKIMAEFNQNPNVAGVRMYFEENNTGYYVMEYVEGCSFEDYIKQHGGHLSWDDTMHIMLPVLDALSAVHEKGIIHRDVTPDNIFITKNGIVKLLDFGAARHSLGNVSRSLDVILKHGFAPKEQYSRRGRQGPFTDVYSVSATIYYALTGVKPDDAIERSTEDTMPYPSNLNAKISLEQEKVLMKGMAVDVRDRYQTAAELRNALIVQSGRKKEDKREGTKRTGATTHSGEMHNRNFPKWLILVGAAAVLVLGLAVGLGLGKQSANFAERDYVSDESKADSGITDVNADTASDNRVIAENEIGSMHTEVDTRKTYTMKNLSNTFDIEYLWGTQYKLADVKTISFRDTLVASPGDAIDVSETGDRSILCWMEDSTLIVAANGKIAPNPDASFLFYDFCYVTEIDFGDCFDTSNVTDMSRMFDDCSSLTSLDLSGFDTSKVIDMGLMFYDCSSLTSLELSGFDTSNVMLMTQMFQSCSSLTSLDLSGFDTSNVMSMFQMFKSCSSLTSLDLSGFDTINLPVGGAGTMFYDCNMLTELKCGDSKILKAYQNK